MADRLSPGITQAQRQGGSVVPPAIATTISCFLTYAQRGPVNKAVKVNSPTEGKSAFGERITSPKLARCPDILDDYQAGGGKTCYLVRYIGSGSAAATSQCTTTGGPSSGSIRSNAATFPASFVPGETFTGSVNGGGAVTATFNAAKAAKTGAGATYAGGAGGTLVIAINGVAGNQTITFSGSENTQALYHDAINAQLVGANAINSGGQTRIQTDVAGSSAGGSIVSATAYILTSLGATVGAFVSLGANNVANIKAVTAAECKTLFDATFVGSTTTVNSDGSVTVSSNTTGPSSSFQFTAGTGVAKIAGFDNALHSGAASAAVNTLLLKLMYGSDESPGAYGNAWTRQCTKVDTVMTKVAVTVAGATSALSVASSSRLNVGDTISVTKSADTQRGIITRINGTVLTLAASITVPGGGYDGTENVVLETFSLTVYDETGAVVSPSPYQGLRMSPLAGRNYFVNALGSTARTVVSATDNTAGVGDPRPGTDSSPVAFTGGLDGSAPAASQVVTAIAAFDGAKDALHFAMPGFTYDYAGADAITIAQGFRAYFERRADANFALSPPLGTVPSGSGGVAEFLATLGASISYMRSYSPWIRDLDRVTGVVGTYPPEARILGMYARVASERGFGKAPAGIKDGYVPGIGLESAEWEKVALDGMGASSGNPYDEAFPAGGNFIIKTEVGLSVMGDQTLDPTSNFGACNVQNVFNVAKRFSRGIMRYTLFEYNDTDTRAEIKKLLTAEYREWRKQRILKGDSDEEAFYIICDERNNTPDVIKAKKFRITHGLAVNVASRFIEETFELDQRAVNAALAAST